MQVTLSGIVIEVKEEQPLKALSPILVTLLGIVTEVKEEQLRKAHSPMLVTPSLIITVLMTEVKSFQGLTLFPTRP